ncbi:MAG: hypothetical protein HUJ70_02310 [Pseudobutyrivibrio sp.]|nr:hypothetical protein [Pseudobutyrivibrio sp.]
MSNQRPPQGGGMRSRANGGSSTKVNTSKQRAALKKKRKAKRIRVSVIVFVLLLLLMLAACYVIKQKIDAENAAMATVSTLTLSADGFVKCEEVVDFDESKYDKKELKETSEDLIKSYNDTMGEECIKLEKFKLKDGIAYMRTSYNSLNDYATFTSLACYNDTVENALEAGYDFLDSFSSVSGGVKGSQVDIATPAHDFEGLNVLVMEQNITVVVPGEVVYVSTGATSVVDGHTVTIAPEDGNPDTITRTYIIYNNQAKELAE